MIYYFDHEKNDFVKIWKSTFWKIIIISLFFLFYLLGRETQRNPIEIKAELGHNQKIENKKESYNYNQNQNDTFNIVKLSSMLKNIGVEYPHIVLAQSIIETGHYRSKIFRKNNNLFGMKFPNQRLTTADSVQFGHACYSDWKKSVYDYAIFQSRYLYNLNTEKQYLNYLDKYYAMKDNYDHIIKRVINQYNLKKKFKNGSNTFTSG